MNQDVVQNLLIKTTSLSLSGPPAYPAACSNSPIARCCRRWHLWVQRPMGHATSSAWPRGLHQATDGLGHIETPHFWRTFAKQNLENGRMSQQKWGCSTKKWVWRLGKIWKSWEFGRTFTNKWWQVLYPPWEKKKTVEMKHANSWNRQPES